MSKVMFTISYNVIAEKREDYLSLMKEMLKHLVEHKEKKYAVYEQKGKKNNFVEVFLCDSVEEFNALEDDEDQTTESLVMRLEEFLENGKMKYTTLMEVF